jgi:hypothetical protein
MTKQTDYGANIEGLRRSLKAVPKEAVGALRDASVSIAADVASLARDRASGIGSTYTLLGPTITATRDRIPVVKIGGSRKLPAHSDGRARTGARQTVGDLLWGVEFGGRGRPETMQFLPHLGTTGYALWPTVREHSDETQAAYAAALDVAMDRSGM